MVLHGDRDASVHVRHARRLARAAGVEPRILAGEGHSDLLDAPELHQDVLRFLAELRSD
jgi:pimeloyl-ACP methyl ester carboxylesterase